jgi:glycosyltransferase involved in cell wall biosynthesis
MTRGGSQVNADDPLRVLHVMWRLTIGGAERSVYQLVRAQRARGISADVLVASELGFYGRQVQETGAYVHELRCRHALDVLRSLSVTAIAERYSVVHFHGLEPLLIAAVSRAKGPRLVYTHRGGVRNHGTVKRARIAFVRRYLKDFSALSGNTRQSACVLASLLGLEDHEIAVTYNGLDFSLLAPQRSKADVLHELPAPARSNILIGTASNLQRLKRVDLLLSSLTALRDMPIHCLVIGDGPTRRELEGQAKVLQLCDRVTFLGRKEYIGDYLQLLDLFVLPSGPEEAFGNAAVEAMGVGLPTVVFADGGGLKEHIAHGDTGMVVRDAGELAVALRELIEVDGLRQELGERGRKYVRSTYSLDAMFERYRALYHDALAAAS